MAWHFAVSIGFGSPRWQTVQRRLIGIWALFIGSVIVVFGVAMMLAPKQFEPVPSRIEGMIPIAAGLIAIAGGIRICRSQSFRPDLGDISPILGKAGGYNEQYILEHRRARRTWWTGDPLPHENRAPDA